jgi:UDP-N-acetylmuramate: L-alanyl-gamma-D-glutamyl-meso-diaminopimelate ligase
VGGSHGKTTTTAMIMHVLKTLNFDFDYLVGASLKGFEQGVKITDAPLMVCEADEYPASTIEKKPKFHFLFPHIAIITGIAWDHINVFPTFEFYLEQFVIFINKIEKNGLLIYNDTDEVLKKLVESHRRDDIAYAPYHLPAHTIDEGKTRVTIGNTSSILKIFGNHNLLNLQAAWLVCKELNISEEAFAGAISDFEGAAKRLQWIGSKNGGNIYRDFAHAPSKVKASIEAVKEQFPDKKLIAILELHTFSSLNKNFMHEYSGAMASADEAIVFYSKHALELKRMDFLEPATVKEGFKKENLEVINERRQLEQKLKKYDGKDANYLFMSSGNYDGMNILTTLNI